jgi:outer membrane receptor for ferrienterochelin and colicins
MRVLVFLLFLSMTSLAQEEISGRITFEGSGVPGVNITQFGHSNGSSTDRDGRFTIHITTQDTVNIIISAVGFKKQRIDFTAIPTQSLHIELEEDALQLEQVVVSASRKAERIGAAPVWVSSLSPRLLENTQALSVAEGLNFTPGLRVENNCQNCGFTQLRMNGLDGAYSQILINSRPVFSALAGVYGLEMIPPNMIERIEVVRGGGSALYGANAIAGTVNVITKTPEQNYFQAGVNQSIIGGDASDRTLSLNGSWVSDSHKSGISYYGFNRSRDFYDANNDGFSEITQLQQLTGGVDGFFRPDENTLIRWGLYAMNEFRRGGSDFDLKPHESQIAEQLEHDIRGANISFEKYKPEKRSKHSLYVSAQWVNRDSYYGAGGRVIAPGDSLAQGDIIALNAYGKSSDLALNTGYQWAKSSRNQKWNWIGGVEYRLNDVLDEMPGYSRIWDQTVHQAGLYSELSYEPIHRLNIALGSRLDYTAIRGEYQLGNSFLNETRTFLIPVPRLTARYFINENWTARASFATGYRTPQAFDEDLHVETVGGAPQFVVFDESLDAETSVSYSASIQKQTNTADRQESIVIEGFYTELQNPFITLNPQQNENGYAVLTKSNGSGMSVFGINAEYNYAWKNDWIVQSGLTLQNALYRNEEVIWEGENKTVLSKRVLRTPNVYGFGSLVYDGWSDWRLSLTAVYTGRMITPHIINPETEETRLVNTRDFVEINLKSQYRFRLGNEMVLNLEWGIQNLFNAYQTDFDRGPLRDAGYIYGPNRPRTIFIGLKYRSRAF